MAEHDRPYHAASRGSSPHTDHLGSTETISDSNGGTTTQQFDPFGKPESPPTPELTRVGFTGQDQDVDLGLTDMKGRIYDPLAGRFTSADPVTQAPFWSQGLNRYSYVFNDPINNTDPSGFESEGLWAGAGAFAAVDLGLLCYGTDCLSGLSFNGGTVGTGLGFGAANIGISYLTGQYDLFNGSGPSKQSARPPSGAPKSSGMNRNAPGALGQNKGAVGPTVQERPANLSLFAPERGALARVNVDCRKNPSLAICQPGAGLEMMSPVGMVVEPGVGLVSRLLGWLFGRAAARAIGTAAAEELGMGIGQALRGLASGKMAGIAERVTASKIVQADAVVATSAAVKALGLRTAVATVGENQVVSSVMLGAAKPVLVVGPSGSVVEGTADLAVDGGKFVVSNVRF